MKEFILGLYANENFPIYLGVIIFVLVIAFFVVLFLGKKDKRKIEETQRLEKINVDAFKETSVPQEVSVPVVETQNTLTKNEIVAVPVMEQTKIEEPVETNEQPVIVNSSIEMPKSQIDDHDLLERENEDFVDRVNTVELNPVIHDPIEPVIPTPVEPVVPVVEPVIEQTAHETNLENFNNLASSIEVELNELERQKELANEVVNKESVVAAETIVSPVIEMPVAPEINPIIMPEVPVIEPVIAETPVTLDVPQVEPTLPEIEAEPAIAPTKVVTDIFSSVYVPKKETIVNFDDTMAIELPRLKDSPVLTDEEESLKL